MSFFGRKPKTAQQKAQMAKTRILLRGLALGFLIYYVIIPMFNPSIEDVEAMHPALRYGILAFFIIASAGLTITTILEYIRNKKAGLYEADAYTDDEGVYSDSVAGASESDEDEDDDDDDDEYDEYDDEDYEYDDEDDYYDDDDDDEDDEYEDDED